MESGGQHPLTAPRSDGRARPPRGHRFQVLPAVDAQERAQHLPSEGGHVTWPVGTSPAQAGLLPGFQTDEISSADWNFLPVSADTCNVEPSLGPEEELLCLPNTHSPGLPVSPPGMGPRPPLARTPSTADSFGLQNGSQSLCLDTESLVLHPGHPKGSPQLPGTSPGGNRVRGPGREGSPVKPEQHVACGRAEVRAQRPSGVRVTGTDEQSFSSYHLA